MHTFTLHTAQIVFWFGSFFLLFLYPFNLLFICGLSFVLFCFRSWATIFTPLATRNRNCISIYNPQCHAIDPIYFILVMLFVLFILGFFLSLFLVCCNEIRLNNEMQLIAAFCIIFQIIELVVVVFEFFSVGLASDNCCCCCVCAFFREQTVK